MGYIYKITNNINGKSYIGKTELTPEIRFRRHKSESRRRDRPLYRAFRKYGIENFSLETLEECSNGEELCNKEIYYIEKYDTFKTGYNCTIGGDGKPYLDYDLIYKTYLECNKHYGETAKKLGISRTNLRVQLQQRFNEEIHKDINKYDEESKIKIIMFNLEGQKLQEFDSINDAERYLIENRNLKINKLSHISAVCKGRRKTAYGYIWKYEEDYMGS